MSRGRSSVTLEGDGWAVGTMLTPAAGRLVLGRSVAGLTDTWIELADVLPDQPPGASLVEAVRSAMARDPHDPAPTSRRSRRSSRGWRRFLPVDEPGLMVNRLVAWLRDHPEVDARRRGGRASSDSPSAASSAWWSSGSG